MDTENEHNTINSKRLKLSALSLQKTTL